MINTKMRKWSVLLLAVILITGMFSQGSMTALASADEVTITVDGKEVLFDEPPVLEDGCVFAPYEAVFEALGAEALWLEEEEAIAVQKGSTLVVMLSGSDRFIKEVDNDGGVIYHMDAAPVIYIY